MCKNDHVALPSCSTSGGQSGGRVDGGEALDFCQFRNAVQILQGFPSGPRIIPGGGICVETVSFEMGMSCMS